MQLIENCWLGLKWLAASWGVNFFTLSTDLCYVLWGPRADLGVGKSRGPLWVFKHLPEQVCFPVFLQQGKIATESPDFANPQLLTKGAIQMESNRGVPFPHLLMVGRKIRSRLLGTAFLWASITDSCSPRRKDLCLLSCSFLIGRHRITLLTS